MAKKEEFDPSWFGLQGDADSSNAKTKTDKNTETKTEIWESLQCLEEIKATAQVIKANQQQSLELTRSIHGMLSFFTILTVIGLILFVVEILLSVFRK